MYSIDGFTQDQIEMQASSVNVRDALLTQVELFYSQTREEAETLLFSKFPFFTDEQIEEIILSLLYIVGALDEYEMERYKSDKTYNPYRRELILSEVIVSFSGTKIMQSLYGSDVEKLLDHSALIVLLLEDIFYEFEQKEFKIGYNEIGMPEYAQEVFMIVGFGFKINPDLVPQWSHFMLPLIEKPNDWSTGISGGYHTLEQSPTLNLGETIQPDEVLEVLNVMQNNTYELHKDADHKYYYEYKVRKMLNDAKTEDDTTDYFSIPFNTIELTEHQQKKIDYTLVSFQQTIDCMKGKNFMFEWKFDFRGRMYETGYNIKTQGDSYQKGMVMPTMSNFEGVDYDNR